MLKFLKHIGQLIMSPGNGWEDISHAGDDPKQLATTGLYPLFGLAAVTAFVQYFYNTDLGLVTLLQQAIIVFVELFVTYFIASVVFASTLQQWVEGEINEKRYTTVITYSLAIIALTTVVKNCSPVEMSLIYFLYLYVGIVLWKSSRYLAIKEDKLGQFIIMSMLSILVPPFIIGAILSFFIG